MIEPLRRPLSAPLSPPPSEPSPPGSLLALGRPRDLPKGILVFSQGEIADRLYYLESGEVSLYKTGRDDSQVEIARIKPGQWFGEAILFASETFMANAVAESPGRLLSYSAAELAPLLRKDPEVAAFFLALLAGKCLTLNRRLEELTVMPARERFLRYLFRLCRSSGRACPRSGPCAFNLPAKKRAIAAELGIVPETLSRAIKALESEGLISVSSAKVVVKDCARLRAELSD